MKRKLVVCKRDSETTQDVLGGYDWYVISKRMGPDGFPVLVGALEERWASEAAALHCARIRLKEGFASVDVCKTIAFSMACGDD